MLRPLQRGLVCLILACTAVATIGSLPATSADAKARRPVGAITTARLNSYTHRLTVRGWAYDPGRPHRSVTVRIRTPYAAVARTRAARLSPRLDRRRSIHGRHAFRISLRWRRRAPSVRLISRGYGPGPLVRLDRRAVRHYRPSPGRRVIALARRFVGKVPYRYGGSSPRTGFDCSGYSMYVYEHARVHRLPHSAQQQRTSRGMHQIARRNARPGDLIFYLHRGYAYHVAIFGGHGTDYAATQPGQRIQHQRIWGRNLVFKTDWH